MQQLLNLKSEINFQNLLFLHFFPKIRATVSLPSISFPVFYG